MWELVSIHCYVLIVNTIIAFANDAGGELNRSCHNTVYLQIPLTLWTTFAE